jgi:lysyl-tRNA synthetase class 1
MFQKPKSAKKLHFGIIPRSVDDYFAHVASYQAQGGPARLENPAWHIHAGHPPSPETSLTFSLLLNLVSVCHAETKALLWGFVGRYEPGLTPENAPVLDALLDYAIAYYRDFVKPGKRYRAATADEAPAFKALSEGLDGLPRTASAEEIQTVVYDVGKRFACFADLKAWFAALYQVLLGQETGPRMGSFIALYGIDETIQLIAEKVSSPPAAEDAAGSAVA